MIFDERELLAKDLTLHSEIMGLIKSENTLGDMVKYNQIKLRNLITMLLKRKKKNIADLKEIV